LPKAEAPAEVAWLFLPTVVEFILEAVAADPTAVAPVFKAAALAPIAVDSCWVAVAVWPSAVEPKAPLAMASMPMAVLVSSSVFDPLPHSRPASGPPGSTHSAVGPATAGATHKKCVIITAVVPVSIFLRFVECVMKIFLEFDEIKIKKCCGGHGLKAAIRQ